MTHSQDLVIVARERYRQTEPCALRGGELLTYNYVRSFVLHWPGHYRLLRLLYVVVPPASGALAAHTFFFMSGEL